MSRQVLVNGQWPLVVPGFRADWWDTLDGRWEFERLTAMRAAIREGDVVIEVGAEQGEFAALFALWGASTVLVEPVARAWPTIKAVHDLNGLPAPVLSTVAFCGGQPANGPLEVAVSEWPAEVGADLFAEPGFQHLDERSDLPCTTVDYLVQLLGDRPSVISIDVEGSEFEVLKGAQRTLADWRPVVFVSVHATFITDRYPGLTADHLHAYMNAAGYDPVFLALDHEAHWMFVPRPEPTP